MPQIAAKLDESFHCGQCNSTWVAPSPSRVEWWNQVAEALAGHVPQIGAIRWLEKNTELDAVTVKTIAAHLCIEHNRCIQCGSALNKTGWIECNSCTALVLNPDRDESNKES